MKLSAAAGADFYIRPKLLAPIDRRRNNGDAVGLTVIAPDTFVARFAHYDGLFRRKRVVFMHHADPDALRQAAEENVAA